MPNHYRRPIGILYCIEYLAYGGTEKQVYSLIERLNKKDFSPHLCCLRKSLIGENRKNDAFKLFRNIKCNKIQLNFVSFTNFNSLIDIIRLIRFIKRNNIDIIQTYFKDPTILGVLAGKLCGVRHVVACFRDLAFWRKETNDRILRLIYRFCTGYIANSEAVKAEYTKLYNLDDKKFSIIYNGIDIGNATMLPEERSDGSKDIVVGIVANLNRKVKRVDVFLRAAAYINKRQKDIKFVVVGDGEFRDDLISLCAELCIFKIVKFIGRIEDVSQCLSKIDIGVISSDSEGFSNAILEYMAAGLPVVATDIGGNKEIIKNTINGFLVAPGDYRSMGEKILQLANEKDTYHKVRENAFDIIRENYNFKHVVENYEKYYEKVNC